MRPQSEINAEIERLMPEREARVHRIEKTFAVCEDTAKREMEGNMTNPATQAAEAMREAAAKAIDNSICDVAENCEIFMYHRDYFVAIVRALPLPEPAADPRYNTTRRSALISDILTDVCDLPDRTSPDDQPDLLQVTASELTAILEGRLPEPAPDQRDATIARLSAERDRLARAICWDVSTDRISDHIDSVIASLATERDRTSRVNARSSEGIARIEELLEIPEDERGFDFGTINRAIAEQAATIARLSANLREAFDAGVEQGSDEATAYDWGAPSRLSRDKAFQEYLRDQERRSRAVKET